MSSCLIDQQWRTNLRERQVSIRIIQRIMYSQVLLVRFAE